MVFLRSTTDVSPNAFIPEALDLKNIHKMDVDAELWLMVDDDDIAQFHDSKIPDWLTNPEVRRSIVTAQEIVNCKEELRRLDVEAESLALHWVEKYRAIEETLRGCQGIPYFSALVALLPF